MALTRYTDEYHLIEHKGIRFLMTEDGKTSIPCWVSHEALQDLASHQHFDGPISHLFETYRPLIESVASDTHGSSARCGGSHPCHIRGSHESRLIGHPPRSSSFCWSAAASAQWYYRARTSAWRA